MKKLLMIAVLATLATTAMALPPNLGPAITTGVTDKGSTVDVRITANVVEGIAVNEVSPIDFGNLPRGMYTGTMSPIMPGKIHIKGGNNKGVNLRLNTTTTNLDWISTNGTTDTTGTVAEIRDVKVIGLTTSDVLYHLDSNGELTRQLSATFEANPTNGNLSNNQKLGAYVGMVRVTATVNP